MVKYKGEDFKVEMTDGVKEQLDADPEAAAAVREMNSRIRQALDGVDMGDMATVDKALRAIGMVPVEDDGGE